MLALLVIVERKKSISSEPELSAWYKQTSRNKQTTFIIIFDDVILIIKNFEYFYLKKNHAQLQHYSRFSKPKIKFKSFCKTIHLFTTGNLIKYNIKSWIYFNFNNQTFNS